jgi:hypothetical protein
MAVDDAYGAKEYRERVGDDELAYRLEHISRRICRAVAEFSFLQARRLHAQVVGGPKWTVSPVYEGMLKEELDAAALRHPDIDYRPMLVDAAFAMLIDHTGDALVVPTLNRDGDLMSDMVMQLFGSIAGAESLLLAFDDDLVPSAVMAEAPHGTAPTLGRVQQPLDVLHGRHRVGCADAIAELQQTKAGDTVTPSPVKSPNSASRRSGSASARITSVLRSSQPPRPSLRAGTSHRDIRHCRQRSRRSCSVFLKTTTSRTIPSPTRSALRSQEAWNVTNYRQRAGSSAASFSTVRVFERRSSR